MTNKYERIDYFLKVFRDIAKENDKLSFGSPMCQKMIYHYLVRLGITEEQMQMDISQSGFFDTWIKRFENVRNINCFVSENWKYFCQFTNKNCNQNDHIKMYIPLDEQHLYNGANIIFDFLASNDIKHSSKIGKHMRFDNIVIRLTNKEDASKLTEFIKNNKYIQEGLIPSNPFTYSKDGIAYACDGYISYNRTVSHCINLYIEDRKKTNKLDDVSVMDFYYFLTKYYENVFLNNNTNKFVYDFSIEEHKVDVENEFKNYKQVIALIIKSAGPNFSFEDYLNHFEACMRGEDIDYLRLPIQKQPEVKNIQTDNNPENLLIEVIDKMAGKYGKQVAIASVKSYLINGLVQHITRTDGLRERVINSNMRSSVLKVLEDNHLDFETYVQLLYEKRADKDDKKDILDFALTQTYNKYEALKQDTNALLGGEDYLKSALNQLLLNNSYIGFTRNNGAREVMINNLTSKDVLNIVWRNYGVGSINEELLKQASEKYTSDLVQSLKKQK